MEQRAARCCCRGLGLPGLGPGGTVALGCRQQRNPAGGRSWSVWLGGRRLQRRARMGWRCGRSTAPLVEAVASGLWVRLWLWQGQQALVGPLQVGRRPKWHRQERLPGQQGLGRQQRCQRRRRRLGPPAGRRRPILRRLKSPLRSTTFWKTLH